MNKIIKVIIFILGIIVLSITSYSLMTGEDDSVPYVQLLLGVMILVLGINEYQENRKPMAVLLFFIAGFTFLVTILKWII